MLNLNYHTLKLMVKSYWKHCFLFNHWSVESDQVIRLKYDLALNNPQSADKPLKKYQSNHTLKGMVFHFF